MTIRESLSAGKDPGWAFLSKIERLYGKKAMKRYILRAAAHRSEVMNDKYRRGG